MGGRVHGQQQHVRGAGASRERGECSCCSEAQQTLGMELAVCELLLGRMEQALLELGLCEGAQAEADPGVQEFVMVNSFLPFLHAMHQPDSRSFPPMWTFNTTIHIQQLVIRGNGSSLLTRAAVLPN